MVASCSSKRTWVSGWRRRFTTGTWSRRERGQVRLDPGPQLLGALGLVPLTRRVAPGADLGDDDEILGVGVEGGVDQLVRHVGPVELRRVDVVDPGLHRPSQNAQRLVPVGGRAEHARPRELHGPEAHARHRPPGQHGGTLSHGRPCAEPRARGSRRRRSGDARPRAPSLAAWRSVRRPAPRRGGSPPCRPAWRAPSIAAAACHRSTRSACRRPAGSATSLIMTTMPPSSSRNQKSEGRTSPDRETFAMLRFLLSFGGADQSDRLA